MATSAASASWRSGSPKSDELAPLGRNVEPSGDCVETPSGESRYQCAELGDDDIDLAHAKAFEGSADQFGMEARGLAILAAKSPRGAIGDANHDLALPQDTFAARFGPSLGRGGKKHHEGRRGSDRFQESVRTCHASSSCHFL